MSRSTSASAKRRQKSPGGGGVGDASGPEGVEVDLVVASDLQVLQPTAAGQEVVGDVQDVVALVIRQVPLEQVEVPVDVVDQAELAGQEVDGPDAAGCDGPGPLGDLVVDVGGGHHRLMAFDAGLILDATGDSPLAGGELSADSGVHSKTSWRRTDEGVKYLDCSPKPGGFRVSSSEGSWDYAWLRTRRLPTGRAGRDDRSTPRNRDRT